MCGEGRIFYIRGSLPWRSMNRPVPGVDKRMDVFHFSHPTRGGGYFVPPVAQKSKSNRRKEQERLLERASYR